MRWGCRISPTVKSAAASAAPRGSKSTSVCPWNTSPSSVAVGGRRDHRHHLGRQRQKVHRQRRQERLERVALLLAGHDRERRLPVAPERVAVVSPRPGSAPRREAGSGGACTAAAARTPDPTAAARRGSSARRTAPARCCAPGSRASGGRPGLRPLSHTPAYGCPAPMKLLFVCAMKTRPSRRPCSTISSSAAPSSVPSGNSRYSQFTESLSYSPIRWT